MSTDLVLTETQLSESLVPAKGRIPADDLPVIAQRYRTGESLQSIGQSYGVTDEAVRQRLEKWALSGHGDTDYHDLVTEFLTEQALQAKDGIVSATDMLGVARAREVTRFWTWVLERRRPKLFGQKQDSGDGQKVMVIVNR